VTCRKLRRDNADMLALSPGQYFYGSNDALGAGFPQASTEARRRDCRAVPTQTQL